MILWHYAVGINYIKMGFCLNCMIDGLKAF